MAELSLRAASLPGLGRGPRKGAGRRVALLASGGLDSSVLMAELALRGWSVDPLFVRCGFLWESAELARLVRLRRALGLGGIRPVRVLDAPVAGLMGGHWAVSGRGTPGAQSACDSVRLPGRNLLLAGLGGLWCSVAGVGVLATALLRGNPFPDARREFLASMSRSLSLALGRRTRLVAPYRSLTKAQVAARVRGFPAELTFSCLRPRGREHCGRCSKCAERARGLGEAP